MLVTLFSSLCISLSLSKGEWKPRQIDNPAYKGEWVHPQIDNPEYSADDQLYMYKDIGAVGFDLWQVWLAIQFMVVL